MYENHPKLWPERQIEVSITSRPRLGGRSWVETKLDEGAGRQTWKCFNPLNCVALAAF